MVSKEKKMFKKYLKIAGSLSLGTLMCSFWSCQGKKSADTPAAAQTNKETKTMTKKTTPSGLSYEILQEAPTDAKSPVKGQQVTVHYTGWLDKNGQPDKKFDSSVDRGQKFTFVIGVGMVIRGWDEGVLDMKKGEKRRLYIPANLGYGSRGAGAVIPPNANLIFDVELFDIK